ncbi:MAG: effector protein, partial [bacterium]|nr:effector protein [bacterium]
MKKSYKHLLSAGRIGSLELKNRICMAPMGTNFSEPDGSVNERTKAYYEERARGGAGLVIVETSAINHPIGVCTPRQIGISGENYLPGLKDLTAGIHRHGSKVAIQLQHAGKIASMDIAAGRALWVASKPAPATGGL